MVAARPFSFGLVGLFVSLFVVVAIAGNAGAVSRNAYNTPEANAVALCSSAPNDRRGAIWISATESQAADTNGYYNATVNVAAETNSVTVYIRGSVYNCGSTRTGDTYALNVSPQGGNAYRLTGLNTSALYRGYSEGRYHWSTRGGQITATLNIAGLAPARVGASSSQTINIDLFRCFSTNGSSATGTCYAETVSITVIRAALPDNYDIYPKLTYNGQSGNTVQAIAPGQSVTLDGSLYNNGTVPTRSHTPRAVYEFVLNSGTAVPNFNTAFNRTTTLRNGDATRYAQPTTNFNTSATTGCTWVATVYPGSACRTILNETTSGAVTPSSANWQSAGLPSAALTLNADDYDANQVVCRFMTVRRFDASHTTTPENYDRRASLPVCVKIGKKPKVQVLGGDLWVGRGSVPSTISTSVTVSRVGSVARTYGSYGEYAVAASGSIAGMASGSGYAGGVSSATLCSAGLLTVNNAQGGACSNTTVGQYTKLPALAPSIAGRFPTSSTSPALSGTVNLSGQTSGVYRALNNGQITLSGATIPRGRWVVINAPGNNIRIAGNIAYTNDALSGLSDIPQVVIIANNITIDESVTRVDAWLVAGGTVTTCSAADLDGANTAQLRDRLHAGRCSQQLTVNGPVIANQLRLRRTAGSEGTGPLLGAPAEVFNFRPDAYLWLVSRSGAGRGVPTVLTRELPPKY